ncbi:hypothetical protein BGX34_001617 [Mortierella sp. NVP85]|nr:hypothetical protein BGX34_001617 [Mortierella sp. NVP85]
MSLLKGCNVDQSFPPPPPPPPQNTSSTSGNGTNIIYNPGDLGRSWDKDFRSGPRDHWALSPGISYIVATGYISLLMIVAIIMCIRARTRLRLYACFCTFLGLTIAGVGILRARLIVEPNHFWMWNFCAESIGMVALTYTIVSVGNGFYPMAGTKNNFWRTSVALIVIYALMAAANIGCYIQQKLVHHRISGKGIMDLRIQIVKEGTKTFEELECQQRYMQDMGCIPPGNLTDIGVSSWEGLTWSEREMYARPITAAYVTHQMLMLFTCVWVSFYLFIPLVRNHRHGPVGRPVDSDMMAVGVWYLSCLLFLNVGYAILNIYYCSNPSLLFQQQAQALDLCIRNTIAAVFFLPAPPFLIRFYRQHFTRFVKGNTVGGTPGSKYGSSRRNGGHGGYQGSFTTVDDPNGSIYEGSRVGRLEDGAASKRTSLEKPTHLTPTSSTAAESQHNSSMPHRNIGMRPFHSRNRGTSSESNKVFNRDFDEEDSRDSREYRQEPARPDSFDQYYNQMGTGSAIIAGAGSDDLQRSSSRAGDGDSIREIEDPLTESKGPRKPERALLSKGSISGSMRSVTGRRESEKDLFVETIEVKDRGVSTSPPKSPEITEVTGTTGWEVGGWGHLRRTSEGMENSLSSPVEPYTFNPPPVPSESNDSVERSTVIDVDTNASDDQPGTSSEPQLTGLQKQLAEYRSALLPVVLAMHDVDDFEPPSATFNKGMVGRHLDMPSTSSLGNGLHSSNIEQASSVMLPLSNDEDVQSAMSSSRIEGVDGSVDNDPMPVHSVDPMHWTKFPPSPKPWPSGNTGYTQSVTDSSQVGSSSTSPAAKCDEKPVAGFRKKWLAGRKSNDAGRQGAPKKYEMDTMTTSSEESKNNKRNSTGPFNINTDVTKGGKTKDTRRGVFSKVLSGAAKGGDRSRQSQDISEQDRDSNPRSEGRSNAILQSSSSIPATVEALASAIVLEEDDEDKGLQYYYPDPYESLAEFRPQKSLQDQDCRSGCLDKSMTTASTRHPLSPTFPETGMCVPADSLGVRKCSSAGNIGTNDHPLGFFPNDAPGNPKPPSVKTAKSSISSRRSFGKGATPSSASTASPGVDFPSPSSAHSMQTGSSLGSLLSRSPSGSKKFGPKARGGRSKSDAAPLRANEELIPPSTPSPTSTMPLPASPRKASVTHDPPLSPPAKTSLSPPPRQSWTRSKSFQGTTSAITAALLSKVPGGYEPMPYSPMTVNTKLANERMGGGSSASERASSSDEPRNSLSSSHGSATSGSMSPTLNSIRETPESRSMETDYRKKMAPSPTSPPLSPLTAPSMRLGGLKQPRSTEYRTNSLDRDSHSRILSSSSGRDRTGFSTAAMDFRRANNREQGLHSLSSNTNIQTPTSPILASGFSYYGVPGTGEENARATPTSYAHFYSAAGSSSSVPQNHNKNKASLDFAHAGGSSSSSKSMKESLAPSIGEDARTNSITGSLHLMQDDLWTQAMVARAQGSGGGGGASSTSGGGGGGGATGTSPYLTSPQLYASPPPPYTSSQHSGQSPSPSPTPGSQSGGYESGSSSRGLQGHSHHNGRNASPLAEYPTRPAINRRGSE